MKNAQQAPGVSEPVDVLPSRASMETDHGTTGNNKPDLPQPKAGGGASGNNRYPKRRKGKGGRSIGTGNQPATHHKAEARASDKLPNMPGLTKEQRESRRRSFEESEITPGEVKSTPVANDSAVERTIYTTTRANETGPQFDL